MVEVVTLHRLLVDGNNAKAEFVGTVPRPRPEGTLATRMDAYARNLTDRSEAAGRAQSAWWTQAQPTHIGQLLSCTVDEFSDASRSAMEELVKATRPASKSGLVAMARLSHGDKDDDKARVFICLKLLLSTEELTRFEEHVAAEEAITEERIRNILPKPPELKKGALVPHPTGAADARVVDEQLPEPAGYWLEFLGLSARPKDPAQAKLAAATAREVLEERIGERAGAVIAEQLSKLSEGDRPVPVRGFLREVAKAGGVPVDEYLAAALQREPTLGERRAQLNPQAVARVDLVITLGGGVKVRGPASALAGRYHIREPQQGDVWVVELESTQEPQVREEIKKGRG